MRMRQGSESEWQNPSPPDSRYMQGDREFPLVRHSSDDFGGNEAVELRPIAAYPPRDYPYYTGGTFLNPNVLPPPRTTYIQGIPRTDIERAMNHYNITEEEYLANPNLYPLPPRGSGLKGGIMGGRLVNPEYLPPTRTTQIQGGRLVNPEYLPPVRRYQIEGGGRIVNEVQIDYDEAYHFGKIAQQGNPSNNVRGASRKE